MSLNESAKMVGNAIATAVVYELRINFDETSMWTILALFLISTSLVIFSNKFFYIFCFIEVHFACLYSPSTHVF